MNGLSVAVVIPVYNGEWCVADAVRSALGQDRPPAEILVVDDASQDGTVAALAPFGDRIRLVRHATNRGPASRNTGITHTSSDLIAFLDADDVWLPHKLREQVALLERNPLVGLCYCGITDCDKDLHRVRSPRMFRRRDAEWVFEELYLNPFSIPTPTVVVRRSVIEECGAFDEELRNAEDYELWLRIAMRHPVSCLPETLCLRRLHSNSVTCTLDPELDITCVSRAFDLCAAAADRWNVKLPLTLEERKLLFLERRCAEYARQGRRREAIYYAERLRQASRFGTRDVVLLHARWLRARVGRYLHRPWR